jgi:hypothetical protein
VSAILCLLLLAASTPRPFIAEDRYRVQPGELEPLILSLRQTPAVVSASYSVESGPDRVRLALVSKEEYERVDNSPSQLSEEALLAATPRGKSGTFTHQVFKKGDYLIMVDNRADKQNTANVQVRVAWHYPKVSQLSPERRFTVVALSFFTFFTVVTYSTRRLLRAVGQGNRPAK